MPGEQYRARCALPFLSSTYPSLRALDIDTILAKSPFTSWGNCIRKREKIAILASDEILERAIVPCR